MTNSDKHLVLLISTTKVPLKAEVVYSNGRAHAPVYMHAHEFRLGCLELKQFADAATELARSEHLWGPWDISGANETPIEEVYYRSGPVSEEAAQKLFLGTEQVMEHFGPKRWKLWRECMNALGRVNLVDSIPRPTKVAAA